MKNRNPVAVFFLSLITLGFYSWYWLVKTKGEMNSKGEKIPTAWLWLVPIIGTYYWMWRYSEGVGHVTRGKLDTVLCFILLVLLGTVGHVVIQHYFNEYAGDQPTMDTQPEATFTPPVAPTAYQPAAPAAGPVVVPVEPVAAPAPQVAPVVPTGDGAEPATQPAS